MSPSERIEEASRWKEEGTREFALGNHLAAAELYKNAAELAIHSHQDLSDAEAGLYVKCWSNAALCFVKEKSWNNVILCCNKVLGKFPNESRTNIKVLYRRGLANMHVDEWEDARADLDAAFAIDGANRDVLVAIKELKVKVAQSDRKERTRYGGIFGRISMYDDKSFNLALVPTARGDELISFPDAVLASVAQFLTKTERALVAVAMTASAKSWRESKWRKRPSVASRAMIAARPMNEVKFNHRLAQSYDWDFLDFKDIDKALAKKLSDDDIGGLLVCTEAVHTIKVLKLKGCINIIGRGLEPLRGSRVLEQLDLSQLGNEESWNSGMGESCFFFPLLPLLKEAAVVPILDSILDDERSALKHLSFPKKWRLDQDPLLSQFLVRYNRFLNRRGLACSHNDPPCDSTCLHLNDSPWIPRSGGCYGIQQSSCYACKCHFCEEHSDIMTPYVCESCELTYCMDCNLTSTCDMCYRTTCQDCSDISMCGICGSDLCNDCCPVFYCDRCDEMRCEECSPSLFCECKGCYRMNCSECTANDDTTDRLVEYCSTCETSFCGEDLVFETYTYGEDKFCGDCNERALLILKQTNKRILQYLHEWEALYGYQERFESDPKSEHVASLFVEQGRMKQRWDHLYSKSNSEQRKKKKDIGCMFAVGRSATV